VDVEDEQGNRGRRLPASAVKLMPTLKDRERQIEQLQGQLKEMQGQVQNTDEFQR
jgi:hypothetical protein